MSALSIEQAAQAVSSGYVVAYPTEAVYGLGCDPLNEQAVHALWQMKHRPAGMGLIVLGGSWDQLVPFMGALTDAQEAQLRASWPGAMTWIVPAAKSVPLWLTGGRDSIALRWTAHDVSAELCLAVGHALVSSSANVHGQPAMRDADALSTVFGAEPKFAGVVSGALGGFETPTPIRDVRTGIWIRQ